MSEQELAAELEYFMQQFGSDGSSFSTILLSGDRSTLPNGVPGTHPFRNEDFLLIDMGLVVDGYCSDFTRNFLSAKYRTNKKKYIIPFYRQLMQ